TKDEKALPVDHVNKQHEHAVFEQLGRKPIDRVLLEEIAANVYHVIYQCIEAIQVDLALSLLHNYTVPPELRQHPIFFVPASKLFFRFFTAAAEPDPERRFVFN
ncbi:MAG: hypothetical protein ACKO96_41570, partial [Flammeovirgaceae bacterium]